MDVKVGRAAFMKEREAAKELMQCLVDVGKHAGKQVRALLTDMNTPLGRTAGNAVEVAESIAALRGSGPADLMEVVFALGAEMLVMGGAAVDLQAAHVQLEELIDSGAAIEKLRSNIVAQGGDPAVIDDPTLLPSASRVELVLAVEAGYIADIDAMAIGHAVVELGGGRRQPSDTVDPRVGIVLRKHLGDAVIAGEPWAEIHADVSSDLSAIEAGVAAAVRITAATVPVPSRILARL